MKPAVFRYEAPHSLTEAVALLAQHGDEAKVLAGGQSLVPMMAFRLATPEVLVDLNEVRELDYARRADEVLVMGALARHRTVQELAWVRDRCAMVGEAVDLVGHPAIRNRGTVAGSLAHADPSAEWPALFLALEGEVDAVGPGGRRTIPAADLFVTYFTTVLGPDEILTEVRLPLPDGGAVGSAFVEVARRHGDFALTGAGVVLRLASDGAVAESRIALIGVRDTAVRARDAEAALVGHEPTEGVLADAAREVQASIDPTSDVHGSAAYRRHLAGVCVRRALARARERARLRMGAG